MDFELNLDELVENYSLDGVYEEVVSFNNITELLFQKTKNQLFQDKITKYLQKAIETSQ